MLSILAIFLHSYASHKKSIEKYQKDMFEEFQARNNPTPAVDSNLSPLCRTSRSGHNDPISMSR